ncbi:response regulator receiver protein, partial [candidate division TM7 genomosp. GTL1]
PENARIHTILCIEDDRFIGEMYVRSLRKAGYEVDWVVTGDEAVTAAKAKAYDLILLDLMLPERRGTDVLETLRNTENDLIPQSRVLVLTNFDQDEESRLAMQAKADGYLIKADITPRKLLEIIGSLSRKI